MLTDNMTTDDLIKSVDSMTRKIKEDRKVIDWLLTEAKRYETLRKIVLMAHLPIPSDSDLEHLKVLGECHTNNDFNNALDSIRKE